MTTRLSLIYAVLVSLLVGVGVAACSSDRGMDQAQPPQNDQYRSSGGGGGY